MALTTINPEFEKLIPQELVKQPCFLNWKVEFNKKGKSLKVPVDNNGRSVAYNAPYAMKPLNEALSMTEKKGWGVGVSLGDGLLISQGNISGYLWCWDFDGFAEVDGHGIDLETLDLLDELNSYTEMSPSGTGFKTFFLTDKQPTTKVKVDFCKSRFADAHPEVDKYLHRAVEIFSKNCSLAMTGILFMEDNYQHLRFLPESELDRVIAKSDALAKDGGGKGLPLKPTNNNQNLFADQQNTNFEYSKLTKKSLEKVLSYIDAHDEQTWSDVSNALARAYGEQGREEFHFYSKQSDKYDKSECNARYDRSLNELSSHPTGYAVNHLIELANSNPSWPNTKLVYDNEIQMFNADFDEPKVNHKCGDLINNGDALIIDNEITEINEQFAWDMSSMNLYCIPTGSYVLKDRFVTQYANRKINTGTAEKPRLTPLGAAWITHEHRRNTPGIVMRPDQPAVLEDGTINSWRGFSCKPLNGDVRPFIKLLKRLIPNIDERRYLLKWFAYMIQHPADKFNVAIVIWSRGQGSGKSLLVETVGGLFNERHFDVVGQEVFSDAFTGWQANKVFILCDEVSSTDKRATSDRIKGWITCSKNAINEKHAPKYSQPNLIKYVFLSNHADAVYIDESDRRFFVVEANSEKLPSKDSREFVKWRDSVGRSALLAFLQNLNTKDFDPTEPAPLSTSKIEMFEDNKTDLERWLDSEISRLNYENKNLVSADGLALDYKQLTGHQCSSRAVSGVLNRRGIKRLEKQARLHDGSKKRLYALKEFDQYDAMSDTELGAKFGAQVFNGQ